ncbi:MAG TPA: peptidylprolyl isomerase, partial [Gemmatimonadaceae bacterium]|nr:peptidylprolyl isomerase [Gemmatimonadaceae bacterium]
MRLSFLFLFAGALPVGAAAQPRAPSRADSLLVGRILLAEDRRDSTDAALARGRTHPDARIRVITARALGRIRDPKFAARDSLPPLPSPPAWPEPAWRLRYRALAARRTDCAALGAALADSAWPVRLRAADLLPAACGSDEAIVATLRRWIDELPADASRRRAGEVSWHAAAHAMPALARLRPGDARERLPRLARHAQWQVRLYAARAAAVLADTVRLRAAARDPNDNVKEAAVDALSKAVGHAADDVYLEVLRARGAQAVRAAALALVGSPRPDARRVAAAIFERWVPRGSASELDARVALLQAAGRLASDDRPPRAPALLPSDAVALALGRDVRVRVTMDSSAGGGSFVVRLRGDVAPVTGGRILALVRRGYYDGLTWHRVEPDFVIQGGSADDNEYV